ncbi:kinase-like domain-containing protein [Trametes polyzona]|nr:kinase-like domain-containing protein [Trametes polyzona]
MTNETQQGVSGEHTQSTQERNTQSTQQASQQEDPVVDANVWGTLFPCNAALSKIKFEKTKRVYRIGAGARGGKMEGEPLDIVFNDVKISKVHCTIEWDGDESPTSAVKVTDMSRNGTFINGKRLTRGHSTILRDGNEIAFGSSKPRDDGTVDFRFTYRHTPSSEPLTGIDKEYDMLSMLGQGGFATVMKALNRKEGRWYAVKKVQVHKLKLKLRDGWNEALARGDKPMDKDTLKLLREITVLKRLKHKNIVELKEVFFDSRHIHLVLELMEGGDLSRYIPNVGEDRRMSEPQTGRIIHQICDALAYVHDMGIAHRDLKPENILLTKAHPPDIKVGDFGLAKVVDTFTDLRSECGSETFLAPEVVNHGDKGYSNVVDSWSVGIITIVMLTSNRVPYVNMLDGGRRTRVMSRQVDWECLLSRGVSKQCEDFVRGLLQVDPQERTKMASARDHAWLAAQLAAVAKDPTGLTFDTLPESHPRKPSLSHESLSAAKSKLQARPCPRTSRASTEEVDDNEPLEPSRTAFARTGTVIGFPEGEETDTEVGGTIQNYKRKLQDRSSSSILSRGDPESQPSQEPEPTAPAPTTAGATEPDKKSQSSGVKKGASRSRGSKRIRAGSSHASVGDSEEVPGLVLRRSSRLNPP